MLELYEQLNKRYGERVDLTQAGGGNISIKLDDDNMIIKNSGVHLADVDAKQGWTIIPIKSKLKAKTRTRVSIEAPVHLVLDKFIVHLHPIQVNKIGCRKDARAIFAKILPDALVIDYVRPGEELAREIKRQRTENEKLILLLNHGVVATADTLESMQTALNRCLRVCSEFTKFDSAQYTACNTISEQIGDKGITILCRVPITGAIHLNLYPDKPVYCGANVMVLDDMKSLRELTPTPNLIYYEQRLYIHGPSYRKCKEIEDVLFAHLECTYGQDGDQLRQLTKTEVTELLGWDAEKYRISLPGTEPAAE